MTEVYYDDCRAAMDFEQENWVVSSQDIAIPLSAWKDTALFMPIWDTQGQYIYKGSY